MHKTLCTKNHTGAAGAIERVGIQQIFRRSIKTRKLRYTGFLGDGDSKSYNTVVSANPPIYSHQIRKLECCGHVQKWMGKRLMDKVVQCKTKSYTENEKTYKGLGGQNRLTQKSIQRIQGHYGAAIRNNRGDVPAMKKSIDYMETPCKGSFRMWRLVSFEDGKGRQRSTCITKICVGWNKASIWGTKLKWST